MARTSHPDDTGSGVPSDATWDPAELTNIAVGALLLVLLLVASFSLARQWSVNGLATTTQVATVSE